MAIVGLGVDLAKVDRFERLLAGPLGRRFVERCFTEGERAYCDRKKVTRSESYAARFAAKEALVKALGGVRGFRYRDVEVVRGEAGEPTLRFHGEVGAEMARRKAKAHVTLTHDAGIAAAVVVLEAA